MRPDSVELADHAGSWAGAYVHIPFCARVCPYCDFNVVAGREDLTAQFVEAVLHEIELESPWNRLDSVAFGGGTPSRLSPVQLISILNGLRTRFGLADRAEVSIEVNPEDWTPSVADDLAAGGFTRVSFGAQSFDRGVLDDLGRLHSPQQISEGVRSAKAAGFGSISLDLIFGTPGESIASWRGSVEKAIALEPDHVSTQGATIRSVTRAMRTIKQTSMNSPRSGSPPPVSSAMKPATTPDLITLVGTTCSPGRKASIWRLGRAHTDTLVGFGIGIFTASRRIWMRLRLIAVLSRGGTCKRPGSASRSVCCSG